jgi:hypothetical protein
MPLMIVLATDDQPMQASKVARPAPPIPKGS